MLPRPRRLALVTTVPLTLEFFTLHLRFLKQQGCDVHVVSSPGRQLEEFGKAAQVESHGVAMSRELSPLRDCRSFFELTRLFRRVRPDIVHSCSPKANLLGPMAARLSGVPIVVSSVFGLPQMAKDGRATCVLDCATRVGCALSDRVWCDSRSMAEYLVARRLCRRDKVITLGEGSVAGVDAAGRFSPARLAGSRPAIRRQWAIPPGALVLGFVGRLAKDKGMDELVSAWAGLRKRDESLHLLLVGGVDSRDPPTAESLRLSEGDSRVHLTGARQDVPELLSAMDVFVMPSYREGFGISNIEASAMEVPIVSTRIPGCVDSVVDGVTGMLVPPRDAGALAEAVWTYVRDPALRARHGRAGRDRVLRDFQPSALGHALEQLYGQLLSQRAKRRGHGNDRGSIHPANE